MKNLEEHFPETRKYIENIEQGFQAPCFLVNLIEYNKENLNESERFFREKETIDIQIIFFPEEEKDRRTEKRQIANIIPKLARSVERLKLYNKSIRATSSKSVIVNDTAQVLVSFDFNTITKIQGVYMENLERVGGALGGTN